MEKEMVLVDKKVLDKILHKLEKLEEKIDNIDHNVDFCAELIGPIAEKMGCA